MDEELVLHSTNLYIRGNSHLHLIRLLLRKIHLVSPAGSVTSEENDTQSFSNILGFASLPAGEGLVRPLAVDEELVSHRTNLCIYDDPHIHLIRLLLRKIHLLPLEKA